MHWGAVPDYNANLLRFPNASTVSTAPGLRLQGDTRAAMAMGAGTSFVSIRPYIYPEIGQ